jgi:spore coat protein U-like protein
MVDMWTVCFRMKEPRQVQVAFRVCPSLTIGVPPIALSACLPIVLKKVFLAREGEPPFVFPAPANPIALMKSLLSPVRIPSALKLGAALCLLLGMGVAQAATSPVKSTMGLSASVANSCRIVSLDSIAFGAYSPISGSTGMGSGALQLICTKAAVATALPTTGGSAMSGPGGSISYGLFIDTGFSKQWGSPGAQNANINFATNVKFASSSSGITQAACATLANGLTYAWQPSGEYGNSTSTYPSTCLYGASSSGTSGTGVTGTNNYGLVVGGKTLVVASIVKGGPGNTDTFNNMSYYAPSGTQVSGFVYSVPASMSGALALTGTSTSAATPVVLTYYAKAPAGQDVTPGTYADTVIVQVSF